MGMFYYLISKGLEFFLLSNSSQKAANTAAFSQLGNLYQYLIVVECCLELPEGELINIEQLGDITHTDFQFEVKHHKDENHQLIDTHIDFWKTISNWVDNRSVLQQYANFVLLTSSSVRDDTLVGDWNRLDATDRREQFKELADAIIASDKEYKSIRKYVDNVQSYFKSASDTEANQLLTKITLKHSYEGAASLWERLKSHQGLLAIPRAQTTSLLISLLGFIASKGITSTGQWDIEVSEFHEFYREQAAGIRNKEHIEYPDLANIDTSGKFENHRFVHEIRRIPYVDKIPVAAKDYYFASETISRIADQNPHVIAGLQDEINQIGDELSAKKENACLSITDTSSSSLTKESKILYNEALMSLKASEKYSKGAKKDFHRGLIHTHVDSSEFKWRIEESDIED